MRRNPRTRHTRQDRTTIRFAVSECSLGTILVATSQAGICALTLGDERRLLVQDLRNRFPNAELIEQDQELQELSTRAIARVEHSASNVPLPLDAQGTPFQTRVWKALQRISHGKTATYAEIARRIGSPRAARAVAQACACNPLAVAIPCHRVLRTDGSLGGYRWGSERKAALLARERELISTAPQQGNTPPMEVRTRTPVRKIAKTVGMPMEAGVQ